MEGASASSGDMKTDGPELPDTALSARGDHCGSFARGPTVDRHRLKACEA